MTTSRRISPIHEFVKRHFSALLTAAGLILKIASGARAQIRLLHLDKSGKAKITFNDRGPMAATKRRNGRW